MNIREKHENFERRGKAKSRKLVFSFQVKYFTYNKILSKSKKHPLQQGGLASMTDSFGVYQGYSRGYNIFSRKKKSNG